MEMKIAFLLLMVTSIQKSYSDEPCKPDVYMCKTEQGLTTYNLSTHECKNGYLRLKYCCGSHKYNPVTHVCKDNIITPKPTLDVDDSATVQPTSTNDDKNNGNFLSLRSGNSIYIGLVTIGYLVVKKYVCSL